MSDLKPWQNLVQCNKCSDIIYSETEGQFVTCKCGAISVDQTPYYSRYIGNIDDFTIIKVIGNG